MWASVIPILAGAAQGAATTPAAPPALSSVGDTTPVLSSGGIQIGNGALPIAGLDTSGLYYPPAPMPVPSTNWQQYAGSYSDFANAVSATNVAAADAARPPPQGVPLEYALIGGVAIVMLLLKR